MNRTTAVILGIVLLAAGSLGVKAAVDARRPHGTDIEQLQQMLFEGERAAEQGNAAGIHHYISPNYRDEFMKGTQIRYQIAQWLKNRRGLELTIPSESIRIDVAPDGRTATVDFHVSGTSQGDSGTFNDLPISLKMVKEEVHYYVLFPGEEWKVISAGGYPALE